jgi:type II secretory pathway component GspD/PulD (secretin)
MAVVAFCLCGELSLGQTDEVASQSATPAVTPAPTATPDSPATASSPASNSASNANEQVKPKSEQVKLEFRQQAWLPALQWLAGELQMNLDWQSLPEGEFSLHSTKEYTLEEAEDLINMQLLARGYTLLKRGEVLRTMPLKEIDITLVPRIEPEDLTALPRHQFVRVSFPLQWMIAEEAAEEFRPLLSPYGQLSPMRSTNRLEVMDAVVNLREMYRLLTRAESDDARRERVAEFQLKHRPAEEVAIKVRQLLGLPPEATVSSNIQNQLDIEQTRFKVEAVKQMGSGAKELLKDKRPDVFLTVNDKENSILVNAPPNKMEIVRQTIEAIDKPLPEHDSTWETVSKVKVHEIEGFDPTAITSLLAALQASGNLAKDARIQHETAYNRIIVFASAEDQLTISHLIESFRAKRRSAAVLPLGSLDAEYAVKAVQLILKTPQRPPSAPGVASDGVFQIEADPDHNRLLLWATDEELKEVQDFLLSLGDNANNTRAKPSNMHVINLNGAVLQDVIERLESVWQDLSDAPLIIESAPPAKAPNSDPKAENATATEPVALNASMRNISSAERSLRLVSSKVGQDSANADNLPNTAEPAKNNAPPVRIVEGEDGELIILSRDAVAAQSAKQLLERILPEPESIVTIALKHCQAVSVRRQLEDFLVQNARSNSSKLATPKESLRIDVDIRTNRLIIQNASSAKLKQVKAMVEILDRPVTPDDRLARQQRTYRFKYRKAEEVSTIVKEVYRDLLSINDRSFSSYSGRGSSGYNQNLAATQNNPEYQGLLSVGVDTEANLIVVSAPGYLLEDIMKLVEKVDTEEDGNSVSITSLSAGGPDSATRQALQRILSSRRR